MPIDHTEFFAAVWDIVCNESKVVLTLAWDGNFPGNSGAIWVCRWKGLYFVSSSDYDPEGPFSSLEEALGLECFHIETSNPELTSTVLPLSKLQQLARPLLGENGDAIMINGTPFVFRGERLVRDRNG